MALYRPDNDPQEQPAAPAPAPAPTNADGSDIIGKVSGFNYTQRWGSRRGQNGSFQLGSRPPSKADWDVMTPEERAAVGISDEETFGKAHEAWQKRFQPGNDIWEERTKAAEAINASGATDWEGIRQALLRAGLSEDPQEQGSFFKQLQMAMEGNSTEHGRYHWNGSNWVDVATSDMNKRGIPGAADYVGPRRSGMDAIRAELPQLHDIERFQGWLANPNANAHDLLNYQHGNMYGTGKQQYDQFGNLIDVATGQRVGHYFPGETRQAYGGGGTAVDFGDPTRAAITGDGGGGGGNPDWSSLPDWLKQMLQQLNIQLPGMEPDLAPKIIPSAIMPGQQQQLNPQNTTRPPATTTAPAPMQNYAPQPPTPPSPPPQPAPQGFGSGQQQQPAWGMQPQQQPQQRMPVAPAAITGNNAAVTPNSTTTPSNPMPTGMQRSPLSGQPQLSGVPQPRPPKQPQMPRTTPRPVGIYG